MLYAGRNLKVVEKEMNWGKLRLVQMGEEGRGRQLLSLPVPDGIDEICEGMHPELSIGATKSGRLRVVRQNDGKLYMLLSSGAGYTRRGDGRIMCLASQADDVQVIARGNGADGDAGRIGNWDCMLINVPFAGCWIRIRPSGGGDSVFLYTGAGGAGVGCVWKAAYDYVGDMADGLGIEIPFAHGADGCDPEEWVVL